MPGGGELKSGLLGSGLQKVLILKGKKIKKIFKEKVFEELVIFPPNTEPVRFDWIHWFMFKKPAFADRFAFDYRFMLEPPARMMKVGERGQRFYSTFDSTLDYSFLFGGKPNRKLVKNPLAGGIESYGMKKKFKEGLKRIKKQLTKREVIPRRTFYIFLMSLFGVNLEPLRLYCPKKKLIEKKKPQGRGSEEWVQCSSCEVPRVHLSPSQIEEVLEVVEEEEVLEVVEENDKFQKGAAVRKLLNTHFPEYRELIGLLKDLYRSAGFDGYFHLYDTSKTERLTEP